MKNSSRRALSVSMLAGFLGLTACSEPVEVSEEVLRPVRFIELSQSGYERSHTYTGTSQSALISRLSFNVGGTLVKFPITVGDTLKKGDLIGRLDSATYDLSAEQAKASLVQAEANQRNAKAQYERFKSLYENNNASRNDLDAARAAFESGAAQVDASQKALELSKLNLSYTELRIDKDCSVATVDVQVNENVSAGQQVAQVNCGRDFEVEIDVPETVVGGIAKNSQVTLNFDSLGDKSYTGRVVEIGIDSSATAATYPVTISIENPGKDIRSGLAASVTFTERTSVEGLLKVPTSAVVNDGLGSYTLIAVPVDEGTAELQRKPVEIGALAGNEIEILAGLEAGDRVVTAGLSLLREGQKVLLDSKVASR